MAEPKCLMCWDNGCQLCTKPDQYPATLIQFGEAKWEYDHTRSPSINSLMVQCNEMGAEGWELISVVPLSNAFWGILKRRKVQ